LPDRFAPLVDFQNRVIPRGDQRIAVLKSRRPPRITRRV
jgi:hypothetical protein